MTIKGLHSFVRSSPSLSFRRHRLRQHNASEAHLLESSRAEEPLLDKLPCLYRSLQPECWREASLLGLVQDIVVEEQQKIVWVEPDLW